MGGIFSPSYFLLVTVASENNTSIVEFRVLMKYSLLYNTATIVSDSHVVNRTGLRIYVMF